MNRNVIFGAIAVAVIAGAGIWMTRGTTGPSVSPIGALNAQEASDVDTSGIVEMTLGAADAPVTVVEYASFTCPHCATFNKSVFKPLKADYIDTGKVKFIYRDVYFDPYGLWASMVARCGGEARFFGISEMLYTQQREWLASDDPAVIGDNLRKIGKVAGMSKDELDVCLNDKDKAQALVAWYQKNVKADDVTGTPTLIIDGEKHPNMSYDDLKTILDAKLAK